MVRVLYGMCYVLCEADVCPTYVQNLWRCLLLLVLEAVVAWFLQVAVWCTAVLLYGLDEEGGEIHPFRVGGAFYQV